MEDLQQELMVFEQKHRCVQEEPAYCSAACPLHVDVREIMTALRKGRWEAAYEAYRKMVLFPGILSQVCAQSCRLRCLRGKQGEAIQIRRVERALARHVSGRAKRHYIRPKNRSAAVVGAGLAGAAAAVTLAAKGYQVTVYEQAAHPGGRLLEHPALIREETICEIEAVLAERGVNLVCDLRVNDPMELTADAILLTCHMPWEGAENLFALPLTKGEPDPAQVIALAKRAALDADRYLSGAPAVREDPVQDTRLVTPLPEDTCPSSAPAPGPSGIYTLEQAQEEAGRCLLCACKACVPHCLFLQEGKQYPKQYIVEAQQSLRTLKLLQSKLKARRTNACNLCGLCKEYCPGGVDMSEVYLYSRRIMHQRGELPEAFHAFWLEDMEFSNAEEAFLCRAQPGYERVKYLFFPGCQLGGADPRYVLDTYRYLTQTLSGGTALYLGCCGAPSEWAGYEERTAGVLEQFQRCYDALGRPEVILACPSCEKQFQKYHPEVSRVSLWALFGQYGLPEEAAVGCGPMALFDPCSSRYDPVTQEWVRVLLSRLNVPFEELPHHGRYAQCCGYGGLIYASNPGTARAVAEDRISASPLPYITYCVNCCEIFRREGKPTWHLLDLLFGRGGMDTAISPSVDLSRRRENRRMLKRDLLNDWWGVRSVENSPWHAVRLELPENLRHKMDQALILEENLQQAIYTAELTHSKLEQRGRSICHLRIGVVTYWVIYRPKSDGGFFVENTYSHRMQLEEEAP